VIIHFSTIRDLFQLIGMILCDWCVCILYCSTVLQIYEKRLIPFVPLWNRSPSVIYFMLPKSVSISLKINFHAIMVFEM
jgi:hypothetical protein